MQSRGVRQLATDYWRGGYTDSEFVDATIQTLVDHQSSDEIVNQAFLLIPDKAFVSLVTRLTEIANEDFYVRTTRLGDPESEDEQHARALFRQSILRRIHHVLLRRSLERRVIFNTGWGKHTEY
ncbi:MAG: hypothetical protein AAGG48_31650 [Planctomycetota bacterium]